MPKENPGHGCFAPRSRPCRHRRSSGAWWRSVFRGEREWIRHEYWITSNVSDVDRVCLCAKCSKRRGRSVRIGGDPRRLHAIFIEPSRLCERRPRYGIPSLRAHCAQSLRYRGVPWIRPLLGRLVDSRQRPHYHSQRKARGRTAKKVKNFFAAAPIRPSINDGRRMVGEGPIERTQGRADAAVPTTAVSAAERARRGQSAS